MKYFVLLIGILTAWGSICPNACSGHGTCDLNGKCTCFKQKGLGLNADANSEGYTGLDCSQRTCPKAAQFSPQIFLVNTRVVDKKADGTNNPDRLLGEDDDFASENITTIQTKEIKEFTTYKLGGSLICYKDSTKKLVVGMIDVLGYDEVNRTMIALESWLDEEKYNMSNSYCIVKYVRKDLSLFNVIDQTREWKYKDYSTLFNKYYGYENSNYNVTLACIVSTEKGNDQYNEVNEYEATMSIEDESIEFDISGEYKPEGNCFLLGGYNNSNVALESSELYTSLLSKVNDRYYYGINMEQDAVIDKIDSNSFEKDDNSGFSEKLKLDTNTISGLSDDDKSTILLALVPGNVLTIIAYPPGNGFGTIVRYTVTIISVKYTETRERMLFEEERVLADGIYEIILSPKIPIYDGYIYSLTTKITEANGAKNAHENVECSNAGMCNRVTGKCECYSGYDGDACQRMLICPNNCNNNGKCVEYTKTLGDNNKFDINLMESFGFGTDSRIVKGKNITELRAKFFGCLCDAGHRGADCSLYECPSTGDPQRATNVDTKGEYRDCSGRGTCDYTTGICQCHDGFTGAACEVIASLQ